MAVEVKNASAWADNGRRHGFQMGKAGRRCRKKVGDVLLEITTDKLTSEVTAEKQKAH